MLTCYFSSHADAENRDLFRDILSTYFAEVIDITEKHNLPSVKPGSILISDRTTFFFSEDYISQFEMAFNVHPSLLPKHKGSFPVLWACLAGDQHGVSIHVMNADVDAGDIVWQRVVPYEDSETFSQVFYRSRQYIVHGLHQVCSRIVSNKVFDGAISQEPDSFHHKKKDGEKLLALMPKRWHTSIAEARSAVESSNI